MFCPKCGKEIYDDAVICPHCGRTTSVNNEINVSKEDNSSKTGIGVLLGLFLGLIGLVIGLCLYKSGTFARKTFLKGWWITFAVLMVIWILYAIFAVVAVSSLV